MLQASTDRVHRPVGLCGRITVERGRETGMCSTNTARRETMDENWVPPTLDVIGWLSLSRDSKMEHERVLRGLDNTCCIPALCHRVVWPANI